MIQTENLHLVAVLFPYSRPIVYFSSIFAKTALHKIPIAEQWQLVFAAIALIGIVAWWWWRKPASKTHTTFLEDALQLVDAGILITDSTGIIIWSNPAAAQLLEIPQSQLPGQTAFNSNWQLLQQNNTLLAANQCFTKALTSGESVCDIVGIPNNSAVKWLQISITPQRDNTGNLRQLICTLKDITKPLELENKLQESQQQLLSLETTGTEIVKRLITALQNSQDKFQQIAVNLPAVIYQMSWQGGENIAFKFVSGDCYELCELEPTEILANCNSFMELLHPDDLISWQEAISDAANSLQLWKWEGRLITASGQLKWFKAIFQPQPCLGSEIIWDGLFIDISDQKKAETAFTKQEQKLALHFQQTPLAVIEWSLAFEVTEWNPAAERIFGYTRTEALGQAAADLIAPEIVKPELNKLWAKMLTNQGWTRNTNENITKDGQIIICEWYNTPLVDETGNLIGVASLVQDITERKLAEEALRESEARFRATFEQTAVGVALVALDGQFLRANQRYCDIVGYSQEELLTIGFYEISHPEDVQITTEAVRWMRLGEMPLDSIQKRYIRKNGTVVWVNLTLSLVKEKSGEPKYFIAAIVDISRRQKAEEELRESQERFRAIAEVTPIPILITSLEDNSLMYANPALAEALGISLPEMQQQEIIDFYENPADRETVLAKFKKDGFVRAQEIRAVKVNGTYFWISLSLQPLKFNGKSALLSAFYDITDRKRASALLLERSRLSTLAAEIGVALIQSSTLPEILHRCTEVMELCLDLSFAGIWTFNKTANLLELQSFTGEQPATAEFSDRIALGFSMIGFIAQNRQSYITPESSKISNDSSVSSWDDPATFLAGYPLIVEDRLVGVMAILSLVPYSEAARSTLSWVANALAVAIDRAWVRQELLSGREALLFQLASQIRTSLELNTILETAVHKIRSLLNIDRCVFIWYTFTAKTDALEIVMEAKNADLETVMGVYDAKVAGSVLPNLSNLEILRVDNAKTEKNRVLRRFSRRLGCNSVLALPIQTRLATSGGMGSSFAIGIVGCVHYSGVRPWSDSEVELLTAVTAQLAIAIDQAELYAQSVNAASVAQAKAEQLASALQELKTTQAQLIQTEKMSSLGQLVAGVAHEINNPINFIYANLSYLEVYSKDLLGLVEIYQKEVGAPSKTIQEKLEAMDFEFLGEDLGKILSSMQVGAERIRQIVLSLRNFSRLDEAAMKFVDLHEGIDNTLLILQSRFKPAKHPGIEVVKEYGSLPKVECYAGQLNQVFLNIFSNAIDALELLPKAGVITVRTELKQSNSSVVIRIIDNGAGMPDAVKLRIFDPFFTTKPVGKGTGLGLSICYQIVVGQHKGVLECFTEQGKGTEFCIEIPIRQR
ncbi:PAS domain S-box protein [Ancylothrix sp. C2]|uniref:PAS domain S-box protein n=1 Tax=Ancylothrix sp. D3o TaxID=2953691 RepID=UPI0021BA7A81|nr:PAS domain S-box protein [Ancylothrix sp. D3o]MCT7949123.1 PAS domain S-box protein [Ancylothrix sp. D3o]